MSWAIFQWLVHGFTTRWLVNDNNVSYFLDVLLKIARWFVDDVSTIKNEPTNDKRGTMSIKCLYGRPCSAFVGQLEKSRAAERNARGWP